MIPLACCKDFKWGGVLQNLIEGKAKPDTPKDISKENIAKKQCDGVHCL